MSQKSATIRTFATTPLSGQTSRAMEHLLAATTGAGRAGMQPDKAHRSLPAGGHRPGPTEPERQAIGLHLAPAVNALIAEALARSGATREDIRQEKLRRKGEPLAAAAVQEGPRGPEG